MVLELKNNAPVLISVIIPAFKERANLARLLPHLHRLAKGHSVEVIVSLGACQENYDDCFDTDMNVQLLKNGRKGRALQMNDGAALANGEVLAFLHADVTPPMGFFRDMETTLAMGYDAGFFSYRFDSDRPMLRLNARFTRTDGFFTGGGDQCLFIKKDIFKAMQGFDATQVLMEDFEFFRRMKRQKVPYAIVPNDLVVSARKYESNSYLRVNLSNLLLVLLFKMGVSAPVLRSVHDRLIRTPYQ